MFPLLLSFPFPLFLFVSLLSVCKLLKSWQLEKRVSTPQIRPSSFLLLLFGPTPAQQLPLLRPYEQVTLLRHGAPPHPGAPLLPSPFKLLTTPLPKTLASSLSFPPAAAASHPLFLPLSLSLFFHQNHQRNWRHKSFTALSPWSSESSPERGNRAVMSSTSSTRKIGSRSCRIVARPPRERHGRQPRLPLLPASAFVPDLDLLHQHLLCELLFQSLQLPGSITCCRSR